MVVAMLIHRPRRSFIPCAKSCVSASACPTSRTCPLLEARVCQYEDTPDKNLVFDHHPEAANVWFVGGGSGHGFKLAPALGEHVAQLVWGRRQPKARFRLSRSSVIKKRDSR